MLFLTHPKNQEAEEVERGDLSELAVVEKFLDEADVMGSAAVVENSGVRRRKKYCTHDTP